jgi:6,7-dimethyl-8-ribityllumazine synthase
MAGPRQAAIGSEDERLDGARILVVEARYYTGIADTLLAGAVRAIEAAGAQHDVLTVPGALEIPTALAIALDGAAAQGRPYAAAVALGCVVRGDTIHFEIVSEQSARGVMDVSLARNIPIGNGILTVNNDAQAQIRASLTDGDKGGEAARAALTLVRIARCYAGVTR